MPATVLSARSRAGALIVELVGPPGSGKSTIASLLQRGDSGTQIETFPYFRSPRHLPFFAWNFMRLAPELLRILICGGTAQFPFRRDIALMIILTGWNETLVRLASHHEGVILLDEGPVCLMAKLRAFGAAALQGSAASQWWQAIYDRWSRTVDMVIVFDAPIPALLDRVRARGIQYEMETMSDQRGHRHLGNIRRAQERVVGDLSRASGRTWVFHVSTAGKQTEAIAEETLALISGRPIPANVATEAGMPI